MRVSSALTALSLLFITCGAEQVWAAGEILPRCSPFDATSAPPLDGARVVRSRPVRDSLAAGQQRNEVCVSARFIAPRATRATSAPGGDWEGVEGSASTGYFAASAFDPVQHRSLMLGGYSQFPADYNWWPVHDGNLWTLTSAPSPRWNAVSPDNAGPAHVGESMIVDTRANRAVAFAGLFDDDGTVGGLSQLPLADPCHWSALSAVGVQPLPRELHSAIYDPMRARMVVFGGEGWSGVLNDTWLLSLGDTPQWTRTDSVAAAPPARFGQGTVYDPVGDRMIIFGGASGAGYFGDLWQLSLGDPPRWTPLEGGAGPSPRIFASMVYDSKRQRIVLLGGRAADGTPLADVWFLPLAEGASWVRADSASFVPGPRWGAAASYDPDNDYVFLGFGVSDPCNFGYYDDSWIFHATDEVPAATLASVTSRNPGSVTLNWSGLPASGCTATVQRRTTGGAWTELASLISGQSHDVSYVDGSAVPGATYDYRLQWFGGAVAGTSAEVRVNVTSLRFALVCTNTNPSRAGLSVAFSLPDAASAQIGVYDVTGRQVLQREVGAQGPGDHLMQLVAPGSLRPGVYLVRLKHGGSSHVIRASVLR